MDKVNTTRHVISPSPRSSSKELGPAVALSAYGRKVFAVTSADSQQPAGGRRDRRLMLVHAHPDDESIGNGVTMAKYVDEGAQVTLVTCTLGEEGEVLVPELSHIASQRDDTLGEHRIGELKAAMAELGVTDHRFLGGPGKYRDTGMASHPEGFAMAPETIHPASFWAADLREAADDLVPVIREVRPQVMITYDEFGGYGHPDH